MTAGTCHCDANHSLFRIGNNAAMMMSVVRPSVPFSWKTSSRIGIIPISVFVSTNFPNSC